MKLIHPIEKFFKTASSLLPIFVYLILFAVNLTSCSQLKEETGPIKVGLLFSQTGTMALSEEPVLEATLMALDDINKQGGLLGRKLEPIIADGKSSLKTYEEHAKNLIEELKVDVLFGCWTSSCRKTIKPVVEKNQSLLIYSVQYEGLEESEHILYTGSLPNQQIIPALSWAIKNLGHTFHLIGSDYIFPHIANEITRDYISLQGSKVTGENYFPLGFQDFEEVVHDLHKINPEVIINTLNGDSNIGFFKALKKYEESGGKHIPVISLSVSETEIALIGDENYKGHYLSWSYFQNLPSSENNLFKERFNHFSNKKFPINDPMVASYMGAKIWAHGVESSGSLEPSRIRNAIGGETFKGPMGDLYIDPQTLHTWKVHYLAKMNDQKNFSTIWSSKEMIPSIPYPVYRPKKYWNSRLIYFFELWGKAWKAPIAKGTQ